VQNRRIENFKKSETNSLFFSDISRECQSRKEFLRIARNRRGWPEDEAGSKLVLPRLYRHASRCVVASSRWGTLSPSKNMDIMH